MDLIEKYDFIDKYQMIIDFFKSMGLYDENYFKYIRRKTKIINLPYDEIREFVGCFPVVEDDKIIDFNIILPTLNTIYDVLIYVHEYSHALDIEDESEIFPNLMESIFLIDYLKDDELIKEQIQKIDKEIINSESENHQIGKKIKLNELKSHFYLN